MEKTKYSIGRYSTSIVELSNSNTGACGGYRKADHFCKLSNKNISDEERDKLNEEEMRAWEREQVKFYCTYHDNILEESNDADKERGGYHKENYIQRMKKRRQTVKELVENNFDSYTSMCITLTFDHDIVERQAQYIKKQDDKSYSEHSSLQSGLRFFLKDLCEEILKHQKRYSNKEKTIQALNIKHAKGLFCDYKGYEMVIERYRTISGYDIHAEYCEMLDELCKINGIKKVREYYIDVDLADLSYCNGLFKKFIQRMHYRYDGFKYVAVMASQDCGHWHYHILCNVPYVSIDEFDEIWTYGGFELKKPNKTEDIYKFEKYMIKNMNEQSWESLRGEKGYLASSKLKRNIVARSWTADPKEVELYEQTKKECAGINKSFVKATDNKFNASFRYYKVKMKSTAFEPCKLAVKKQTNKFIKNNANETKVIRTCTMNSHCGEKSKKK